MVRSWCGRRAIRPGCTDPEGGVEARGGPMDSHTGSRRWYHDWRKVAGVVVGVGCFLAVLPLLVAGALAAALWFWGTIP